MTHYRLIEPRERVEDWRYNALGIALFVLTVVGACWLVP